MDDPRPLQNPRTIPADPDWDKVYSSVAWSADQTYWVGFDQQGRIVVVEVSDLVVTPLTNFAARRKP